MTCINNEIYQSEALCSAAITLDQQCIKTQDRYCCDKYLINYPTQYCEGAITSESYECIDHCSYPAKCVQMDDNYCISAIDLAQDAPNSNILKIALGVGLGIAVIITILAIFLYYKFKKNRPSFMVSPLYLTYGQVNPVIVSQMAQPVQNNQTQNPVQQNKTVMVMSGSVLEQVQVANAGSQNGAKNDTSIPWMPVM
ncbi:Hypothetical_protein [Hexamita inflata]|uniref:Hypothetical_protein n=1 Tax=Hexamita inflata TaxID=28002 RepID=A0AA86NEY5_9EUKA|nr:Hypothetical protein HINF_LOCUS6237 [Hexamita inflata]